MHSAIVCSTMGPKAVHVAFAVITQASVNCKPELNRMHGIKQTKIKITKKCRFNDFIQDTHRNTSACRTLSLVCGAFHTWIERLEKLYGSTETNTVALLEIIHSTKLVQKVLVWQNVRLFFATTTSPKQYRRGRTE